MDILVIGDDMLSNAPNDERPLEFVITQDQIDKRITKEGQAVLLGVTKEHSTAEMVTLTQEYLDSQVDVDDLVSTFHRFHESDLRTRLTYGKLNTDFDGDLPDDFYQRMRDRIANLLLNRKETLNKSINWLTHRVDSEGKVWHSFPMPAYRFGLTDNEVCRAPGVISALQRLSKRSHIRSIKVTGPLPQHWYHGVISFD